MEKEKLSEHAVAMEDEELSMDKTGKTAKAHEESDEAGDDFNSLTTEGISEHAAAMEDEELSMDKIREMAKAHEEPEAAMDDEELTLDMIRAQARAHEEPDVADLATSLRARLHLILFEVRTPVGKAVNYFILTLIVAVVLSSMMGTVPAFKGDWSEHFAVFELFVLYIFLLEYVLRIYSAKHRWDYIRSFNGAVDFLTVLPLVLAGQGMVAVRLLRLLRLVKITTFFPVLKSLFISVSGAIGLIVAVLGTITLISLLVGNLIFLAEPETFGNAFQGLWWSLVTMSTVGYGDFVPQTVIGKVLGGVLILAGILMFAMVTAVISVRVGRMVHMSSVCVNCDKSISPDYEYCPFCGGSQEDDIQLFGNE